MSKIAQIGHPILRKKTQELSLQELSSKLVQDFIDELINTMRQANGAGLAANQIYKSWRICAVEVDNNPRYPYKPKIPLTLLVNPHIELIGDKEFEHFEGCLSVPNLRGRVKRSTHIHIKALDRFGKPLNFESRGVSAGTFQHEIDHLDGILFIDKVHDPKSLCTWENFETYEKESYIKETSYLIENIS